MKTATTPVLEFGHDAQSGAGDRWWDAKRRGVIQRIRARLGKGGAVADHPAKWSPRLRETHHHEYGQPWCLGRSQMDYLVRRGLPRDAHVLDFGCGSGRTGIWLIRWLGPDQYCGLDRHVPSLEAFAHYEVPLHGLEDRRPRLLATSCFDTTHFGRRFDWVLAFSVLNHLPPESQRRALQKICEVLQPDGTLVLSHRLPMELDELHRSFGLVCSHEETQAVSWFDGEIRWFELRRG